MGIHVSQVAWRSIFRSNGRVNLCVHLRMCCFDLILHCFDLILLNLGPGLLYLGPGLLYLGPVLLSFRPLILRSSHVLRGAPPAKRAPEATVWLEWVGGAGITESMYRIYPWVGPWQYPAGIPTRYTPLPRVHPSHRTLYMGCPACTLGP